MAEKRYARIINPKTNEVQVGVGCTEAFYKEIGMTEMMVEQASNGKWYTIEVALELSGPRTEDELQERIDKLKKLLSDSDYKVVKCMECKMLKLTLPYDLKELHEQRQAWRDEINELTKRLVRK